MKCILSLKVCLFLCFQVFGQFSDTSGLNNFIRDSIRDKRPDKVTAAQLQKAFLGTTHFLSGPSANFANTNLQLNGDRIHDGNYKSLLLSRFASINWNASNSDNSIITNFSMDSLGRMSTVANNSSNIYLSNPQGPSHWYVQAYDPAESRYGFMFASPLVVQLSANKSSGIQSALMLNGDLLKLAALDGQLHGDSLFASYSDLTASANSSMLSATNSSGSIFQQSRDYLSMDTSYRFIEQLDKVSLSPIRRTSFNQDRSGFSFTASGSGNPEHRVMAVSPDLQCIGDCDSALAGYALRIEQPDGRIFLGDVAGKRNGVVLKIEDDEQAVSLSKNNTSRFVFNTEDGTARFATYGTVQHTGTAASQPYFDATGNVIEKPVPQYFAQTATTTVSGTNTETSLVGGGVGSLTIPASSWVAGKTYRVTIAGRYTSDVNNPMSLHPKLKLGSVVIAEKNTFIGSNRNAQFRVVVEFTCRTTGASGTIMSFGNMWSQDAINEFSNGGTASTINMTTDHTLDITAILNDSSPGNSISAYMILLEEVN